MSTYLQLAKQIANEKNIRTQCGERERSGISGKSASADPARQLERRIVMWLNEHPAPSFPGHCAHCGGGEGNDGGVLLPFGAADAGHSWLHGNCWRAWYDQRRALARRALAAMGVPPILD